MPVVRRGELNIYWTERGEPDFDHPPVVLLHGLLLSARLFERLAATLGDRWVVLIDLHGHGKSSRPTDPDSYTWSAFADDVIAVLDALDVDEAVIGGLSLGANVTLTFAAEHPGRCAGLIVEMPVLIDSEAEAKRRFGPLAKALRVGAPVLAPAGQVIRRVPLPRRPAELALLRDTLSVEPLAGAALLEGLLASDRFDEAVLAHVGAPTLVIGHHHDPMHAISDARRVARLMPNATLKEVGSLLHYRVRPNDLARLVTGFLNRNGL